MSTFAVFQLSVFQLYRGTHIEIIKICSFLYMIYSQSVLFCTQDMIYHTTNFEKNTELANTMYVTHNMQISNINVL